MRLAVLLVVSVVVVAACSPDPHHMQLVSLLDQLVGARAMLSEQPPRADAACNTVGEVETRLVGEPGLADVRPAWPALRDAAKALQAVCGQDTLLAQPSNDSAAMLQARQRWQDGVRRETGVACDHLRQAAAALGRAAPC